MNWKSTKNSLPKAGSKVLIVRDVRKWDSKRKPHVDIANVGYFEKSILIGGPNSLTGYHRMKGIYFAVLAILHPESVTFWKEIPKLPKSIKLLIMRKEEILTSEQIRDSLFENRKTKTAIVGIQEYIKRNHTHYTLREIFAL